MVLAAGHTPDPIDHVIDNPEGHWEIFDALFGEPVVIHLRSFDIFGYQFQLTKYMVLELIVAVAILAIYLPMARRVRTGELARGSWWNWFEGILTFVRNNIAKPNLGEHHADRFVPYLWTVFLFILFCNLLGMFPWMGSPTASIAVTGALAVLSFLLMHFVPIFMHGPIKYLKSMWVETGLPFYAAAPIAGMIFVIEFMGTAIKAFVLSVRLFANMFAGHMVLSMILLFIVMVGQDGFSALWPVVTISSVLGVVALSLLELFVAFVQAYVFTFLTALFVGMSLQHIEAHAAHEHAAEGAGHH